MQLSCLLYGPKPDDHSNMHDILSLFTAYSNTNQLMNALVLVKSKYSLRVIASGNNHYSKWEVNVLSLCSYSLLGIILVLLVYCLLFN